MPGNSIGAVATPLPAPIRAPRVPRGRADPDSDVSDSLDDSEPDDDDPGVQNDAVLGAVEGENVMNLTELHWEEVPLPQVGTLLQLDLLQLEI
jgi:hypothetical protein